MRKALLTGRDRDMGPPLGWWRGPTWLGWALLLVALCSWAFNMWVVWINMTHMVTGTLVVLVLFAAVLMARYRPLTAARLTAFGTVFAAVVTRPIENSFGIVHSWPLDAYLIPAAPVVALAIARARRQDMGGIASMACAAMAAATGPVAGRYGLGVMAGPLVGLVAVIIAGYVLNDARRARLETEQERLKRSHLQQRARIARELHDVIGHHLSMIAVRTDSARYRIAGVTPEIHDEFTALGTAAREALTEARRLIGVLREDNADAEHFPQPTVDDIPDLVRSAVASGASARLEVDEPMPDVPAVVGLAAYRIVQESLSNAMRHSPGAPITVWLRASGKDIELSVDNGPSGRVATAGGGTGLAGIEERVGMIGGECTAGRRADGGFQVWARLPG
nr:Putative two-component system sensor kinase [Kibdelosporangium sp. MJ126-NF4]